MTHDINGPSSLFRRELCPGSARLEAQMPDEANEHSERGDKLHAITADALRKRLMPTLADLTDDDRQAVKSCIDYGLSEIAAADDAGATVLIEHKLDLETVGIGKGGTLDLAIVYPNGYFRVTDWKFGQVEATDPHWNRQTQTYAIGLVREFGCTHGTAVIAQPAHWQPIRTAEYSPEDLARWESQVSHIVARTKDPEAPLVPGSHCQYCKARNACSARRVLADSVIAVKPSSVIDHLHSLAPSDRRDYYERMKLARAWLDGALDTVEAEGVAGRLTIPGYRVGPGRASRIWAQESAAEMALTVQLGADGAYQKKLLSPAQAEKALSDKLGLKTAKAVLKELIAVKDGAPKLVPDGAKDVE